jgi:hypothetical protein
MHLNNIQKMRKKRKAKTYTSKWLQVPMKTCSYKSIPNTSAPLCDVLIEIVGPNLLMVHSGQYHGPLGIYILTTPMHLE